MLTLSFKHFCRNYMYFVSASRIHNIFYTRLFMFHFSHFYVSHSLRLVPLKFIVNYILWILNVKEKWMNIHIFTGEESRQNIYFWMVSVCSHSAHAKKSNLKFRPKTFLSNVHVKIINGLSINILRTTYPQNDQHQQKKIATRP